MKPKPNVGDSVRVCFSGGIEGEAFGTVIEGPAECGDFKMVLTEDFVDRLGTTWRSPMERFSRKGSKFIVHEKELVEIIS